MTSEIGQVEILDLTTGSFVEASLFEGLADRHIDSCEANWYPILQQQSSEIRKKHITADGKLNWEAYQKELAINGIQDHHWDWRGKRNCYGVLLQYKSFALECCGELQGLLCVNLLERCELPEQKGKPLVYVEYITVAPWNRAQLYQQPKYKYVGSVLLATAISASIDEEYDGRIGLHSLPEADTYYAHIVGMVNLGITPRYDNLNYFELTPDGARKFLNNK